MTRRFAPIQSRGGAMRAGFYRFCTSGAVGTLHFSQYP